MRHSEDHDELLQRLLCRELAPDAHEVRERLGSCPECSTQWQRLSGLDARLSAFGTAQQDDLARSRTEADRDDEERVRRSFLAALARSGTPTARPGRRLRFAWLAAVAAVLLAVWLLRGRAPTVPEPEFLLGREEGPIECLAPLGSDASYDEFRWRDERPPSGWFRLTIHPLEVGPDGAPAIGAPVVSEEVSTDRWRPSPELARELPSPLWYEVQALDANGALVPGLRGAGSASR
jgi:hypothetical protein